MPNLCSFSMVVGGTKKDIKEWISRMRTRDNPNHFFRIFGINAYAVDAENIYGFPPDNHGMLRDVDVWINDQNKLCENVTTSDNETLFVRIDGDCAWSLNTCCLGTGYADRDLFAQNTRELNLVMEAYSEEAGMCFQEHYVYDRGQCIESECVEFYSLHYDEEDWESFEKFKEEYKDIIPTNATIDDLNDGGYYSAGGFEDWNFNTVFALLITIRPDVDYSKEIIIKDISELF